MYSLSVPCLKIINFVINTIICYGSSFTNILLQLAHCYDPECSGVAKVGNGWEQAQPIMSSAQPIFMSIVHSIYTPFHIKYVIYRLFNTQITYFEFVCVAYI